MYRLLSAINHIYTVLSNKFMLLHKTSLNRPPLCFSYYDSASTPSFSREGYGRQSMSEKRKLFFDPHALEIYQKIKSGKESGQFSSGEF